MEVPELDGTLEAVMAGVGNARLIQKRYAGTILRMGADQHRIGVALTLEKPSPDRRSQNADFDVPRGACDRGT